MFKILRSMRGLQRRFAILVFASVLVFLVYLLMSNSAHLQQSASSVQDKPRAVDVDGVDKRDVMHTTQSRVGADGKPNIDEQAVIEQQPRLATTKSSKPLPPDRKLATTVTTSSITTTTLPPLATDLSNPYSGPRNREQQQIVAAFLHAWNFYKKYAWGHDELKPLSKGWQEWMGIGLTIVDSLDTLYIMGLHNEFAEAREWVATKLSFDRDHEVQLFEIVIRELGGLLSAYHLSGDKIFLDKAVDLANRLFPCFSGPTSIPCNRINLKRSRAHFLEISTAEVATIQLEFRDLSRSTGDDKFEVELGTRLFPCLMGLTPIPCNRINLRRGLAAFTDTSVAEIGSIQLEFRDLARSSANISYEKAIDAVSQHLHNMNKLDGLVPCYINPHTGEFRPSSTVSVGASADSYYEYLVKQWIQTGKTKDWLKNDYLEAMAGIEKHLYRHTQYSHLGFVGAYYNMNTRSFRPDMEHLACFYPGTLALGYMSGLKYDNLLAMAENITYTCYQMYARMPTGLSPEVVTMNMNGNDKDDFYVMTSSAFNLQRPETIESIFYMYRLTRDPKYRQWGWKIFEAFEKYTKLPGGGYASISNVKNAKDPGFRDKMETFYLAETLKYLYLLFSDDPQLVPLDKYVINSEAHPLPVYEN